MPKTKFQELIFTLMMAFAMVYVMICYNISLGSGGLSNSVFATALHEVILMWPVACILEMFVVGGLSKKLAFRIVTPGKDNPTMITVAISTMIVCLMCPMMSAVATLLFQNAGVQFVAVWLQTTALNFPMALCWQIFFAGPLVRLLFRTIFKKQLAAA
jgi:hypothetical protein